MTNIPLERYHDLSGIPESGYETSIAAAPAELKALAEWAGVDEVERLSGHVRVHRQSRTSYQIETEFEADVVQNCVVTLEPVRSHIARSFTRALHLSPSIRHHVDEGGLVPAASVEDDAPDEIENTRYDLAAPLREEFALAIDSYPRAPGVEFEQPDDPGDHEESPFAALEKLRPSH